MKPSSKRSNERGCYSVGFHGPAANWGAQSTWPSSSGRTIPAAMNNTRFDSGGFLVCLVTSRIGRDTDEFSFFFSLYLSTLGICVYDIYYMYVRVQCTYNIYIYLFLFTDDFLLIGDDVIVDGGTTCCHVNILNRILRWLSQIYTYYILYHHHSYFSCIM